MQVLLLLRRTISSIYHYISVLCFTGELFTDSLKLKIIAMFEAQSERKWSSRWPRMLFSRAPAINRCFFAGTARLKSQMSPPLFFRRRQCPRKLKLSLPSCPHLTRCHYNLVRHFHLVDFSTVFFHICHGRQKSAE